MRVDWELERVDSQQGTLGYQPVRGGGRGGASWGTQRRGGRSFPSWGTWDAAERAGLDTVIIRL